MRQQHIWVLSGILIGLLPLGCLVEDSRWDALAVNVSAQGGSQPMLSRAKWSVSPRVQALAAGDRSWATPKPARWRYIVIHHSATRWGNAARFHKVHLRDRKWVNGLGYHFVIGNGVDSGDGQIEVGPRWRRQIAGAHCGNRFYNTFGIGICLVGNFERGLPTRAQMISLRRLVGYLQARFSIDRRGVITHKAVKSTTLCPGRKFPYLAFISSLRPDLRK